MKAVQIACILFLATWVMPWSALANKGNNLIVNHDFSQGIDHEEVPTGWTSFARSDVTGFRLSDEQSSVGGHSVYVYDWSLERGAGLRSARVPASEGMWFLAEVDVLAESGRMTLYMDFLDANGRRVEAKLGHVPAGETWKTLTVQAQAPAGTHYVTLILYSAVNNQGAGYFDNVRLFNITEAVAVEDNPVAQMPTGSPMIGFRPADGAHVQVNPPPLIWEPIADAVSYVVELSQDPTFPAQSTVRVSDVNLPLHTLANPLDAGQWYWRYQGVMANGMTSEVSAHRSFTVPEGVTELPLPERTEWKARIPTEHPRLFVRPETIDEIRSRMHTPSVESLFPQARIAALTGAVYPEEPPNPRAGGTLDIDAWRAAGAQMTPPLDTLHEMAFLYLVTQKDSYAQEGRQLLMHFARMDPSGLTSYRDGAPETAMRMLYYLPRVYTWLHDVLTEEEREIVRQSARVRGQEAYSMIKGRPFETNPFGSHVGRMLGFLGQLSIAFFDEIPEAEEWLDYVVQLMYAVYPAWGAEDGGYAEGLSYWQSYMNWVFDFLDAFHVATDINLYEKPFFRETGYFALYTGAAGSKTPFSDGHNATPGTGQRRVATHLARMHQNGHYTWYANQLGGTIERSTMHQLLLDYPPIPPAQSPDELPDARWFRDVGWVSMHQDLTNPRQSMQFTFKSSPYGSVSHSHADQNAFVLYAYGDGLATSTGYYPYYNSPHHAQWTNQTLSKNSILIDGRGQLTANYHAEGQILGMFHSDRYDYTAGEAAIAYNNVKLRRFTRHVVYIRPDVFLLVDDIRATHPITIDWLLHSDFQLTWDASTQTAHTQGRTAEMDIHLLAPTALNVSITDQFVPTPEATYTNAWHMTARLPGTWEEAAIVAVLTPRRRTAEGPVVIDSSVTSEGDVLRIELVLDDSGTKSTEIIYMQFPATDESADLANVRIVSRNDAGEITGEMAVGNISPIRSDATITAIPHALAVTAEWDREARVINVTTGDPRLGTLGISDFDGMISLKAGFVPGAVRLNDALLEAGDWSYDAATGELRIAR